MKIAFSFPQLSQSSFKNEENYVLYKCLIKDRQASTNLTTGPKILRIFENDDSGAICSRKIKTILLYNHKGL